MDVQQPALDDGLAAAAVRKQQNDVRPQLAEATWLAALLHPTKNPRRDLFGRMRWFKCFKGPDHEWVDEPVAVLRRGPARACPCCAGLQASRTNCVATLCPEVAREWRLAKRNGPAVPGPEKVMATSQAAVWLRCRNAPAHGEYRAVVAAVVRTKGGCPECAGTVVTKSNSLKATLGPAATQLVDVSQVPRLKPAQILGTAAAEVACRDPTTGYAWRATPRALTEAANQTPKTPDAPPADPMEKILDAFVPRALRARAAGMVKQASTLAFPKVVDGLVDDAVAALARTLMDEAKAGKKVANAPPPPPKKSPRTPRRIPGLSARPRPPPRKKDPEAAAMRAAAVARTRDANAAARAADAAAASLAVAAAAAALAARATPPEPPPAAPRAPKPPPPAAPPPKKKKSKACALM